MISLNISEEILVKHIQYLLGNGLEERIRNLITDDIVNHIGDKLGADVADEHKRFVKFILNEINALKEKEICDLNDNLFVGNFNALNTVIKFVLQGFPNIDASIRGQKQIYKNKNYQEILLDAFGYEKFSQEPLAIFYNKECEFIKKVTKKYLKSLLEETQGDHKEAIKLLIEDLNKAYIEGDFIISEIMFILKDSLQEILHTEYRNKNKFIKAKAKGGELKVMSSEEVFEKVKAIIVEQLGAAEASVTLEASFIDDLGADSLDIVELIMALEEEFDMEIPDADAEKIVTVNDVVEYIKENA